MPFAGVCAGSCRAILWRRFTLVPLLVWTLYRTCERAVIPVLQRCLVRVVVLLLLLFVVVVLLLLLCVVVVCCCGSVLLLCVVVVLLLLCAVLCCVHKM